MGYIIGMDTDVVRKMLDEAKKEKHNLECKIKTLQEVLDAQKLVRSCSFKEFKRDRVRIDRTSNERTTIPDLWRAYRYWNEAVGSEGKRLTQYLFVKELEKDFGAPVDTKYYVGVFSFNTQEEVEEYDTTQQPLSSTSGSGLP